MWKLIWKDSLHYDMSNFSAISFYPMIYITYMNLFVLGKHSEYKSIFGILFFLILLILTIFPLKLAKGLYLCPLTEAERKKYLVIACFLRLGTMILLLGLVLMVSRFFLEADNLILLIQFICGGIFILGAILTSLLPGSNSADLAKQKFYIAQKLPVPKKQKVVPEELKTTIKSILLLLTVLILAFIGILLPMNAKEFNKLLWFYYIPSFLVSVVCMLVYFIKYFDEGITFNANREVYQNLRKKKAGAFHAD